MTFSRRHVGIGMGMAAAAASVALFEKRANAQQTVSGPTFNVGDFGAVGDGVTDDAPAFQAAFDAAFQGGIVFVPPGRYRIASTVTANLLGGGSHFVLRGSGGQSEILVAAPQNFHIDNVDGLVAIQDLVFVGSLDGNDCIVAISLHGNGMAVVERCSFYGVGGHGSEYYADWGSVIHAFNCPTKLSNCSFYGCFGEQAVVLVSQLRTLTLEDCNFIDIGALHGVTYSKVGGAGNGPWVRVRHLARQAETATQQNAVRLIRCVFDEGPGHSVIVGGERVQRVGLQDCMFNVLGLGIGGRFENVEHVTIEGGFVGWANVASNAFELFGCGTTKIEHVRTKEGASANQLFADAECRYLRIVDSLFHGGVTSAALRTVIEIDGVQIVPAAPPAACDDSGGGGDDHDVDVDVDPGDGSGQGGGDGSGDGAGQGGGGASDDDDDDDSDDDGGYTHAGHGADDERDD